MANNTATTHVIRGVLHWAKVLGEPRMNTYTKEREWSVDLTPDKAGRAELKRIGLTSKLRDPKDNDDRDDTFISFRHREFRKDGKPNDPLRIVGPDGSLWPENKLIGNGTVADVKFQLKDYGKGNPKGVYIRAIRVLDHVEYEVQEFAPLSKDDEYFSADEDEVKNEQASEDSFDDDDLDDDVAF